MVERYQMGKNNNAGSPDSLFYLYMLFYLYTFMDIETFKNINHDIRNVVPLTKHQLDFLKTKIDNLELFKIIISFNEVLKCYDETILSLK